MDLIIKNKKITTPIDEILLEVRKQHRNGFLSDIKRTTTNIVCTCPFHKDGHERKPSCSILNIQDDDKLEYGTYHCWSCGAKGPLYTLINQCFLQPYDSEFGKDWLIENFGNIFVDEIPFLPEITFNINTGTPPLPTTCLNHYEYNNPAALDYLINKRHLKKEVIDYFQIGYNKDTNSVTFPCWNDKGKLVGIFERNISTKLFKIPEIDPKPIYLLNEIIKGGYTTVFVAESQINALTLWGYGLPAVALFGTGSDKQYEILKKSGIRNYVLCFDGDQAGLHGRNRFINALHDNCIINYYQLPDGKDINDLTYEEFLQLPCYGG